MTLSMAARQRAETLFERVERLARAFRPPPELPAEAVDAALESWRRAAAQGDAAAFERRLAWDGIDARIAALAFVDAEGGVDDPWCANMERWLQEVGAARPAEVDLVGAPAELPFAELVAPWVAVAARRVEAAAPGRPDALAPAAWQSWQAALARRLSWLASLGLFARFERERTEGGESESGESGCWARYVARERGDGFAALAEELPVLVRQLAERCEDWVASSVELIDRVLADRDRLAAELGGGAAIGAVGPVGAIGAVTALDAGLSDPHAGGRRVVALRFASGLEVVLKPRPVALEALYERACRELGAAGFELAPRAPRVLDRGEYGWVERVSAAEADDEPGAEGWFRRAGALVAIAWLLGGRDLHAENLIAGREGPLLVDAEMLLAPLSEAGADSVLATGLVADPEAAAGPGAWGYAGLDVPDDQELPEEEREWTGLGSDGLRLGWRRPRARALDNVARVGGRPQRPEVFREFLIEGFERAARFVAGQRERLGDLLASAEAASTRVLLRPSARYATTLAVAARPRYLADGRAASLLREALLRPLTAVAERPAIWPLVAAERAALERFDLPVFRIGVGETALVTDAGERVEGLFVRSGLAAARARLAALDDAEIGRQSGRLAAALAPRRLPPAEEEQQLAAAAAGIAAALAAAAPFAAGPEATPEATLTLRRLALYGGAAGRALFAAGAHRATGEPGWRELAHRLAAATAAAAARVPAVGEEVSRCGATDGWGSLVWSGVWLAELLESTEPLALARIAAERMERAPDGAGRWGFDLAAGEAGAVLALLALAEVEPGGGALAAARRRGERLLAAQIAAGADAGAWPTATGGPPLAGFAHGAAGIARALDALAAAGGEPHFAAAADRAFAWERSRFEPERRDWPVRLAAAGGGVERRYLGAWCHGAPGIGLARVARLARREDAGARADLERALAFAAESALPEVDHLCCGTASRLALFAAAGRALGDEAALGSGRALARRARARAEGRGSWAVGPGAEPAERADLGFFRGYPGLAWSLISLTPAGAGLPLVALLELPSERRRRPRSTP